MPLPQVQSQLLPGDRPGAVDAHQEVGAPGLAQVAQDQLPDHNVDIFLLLLKELPQE